MEKAKHGLSFKEKQYWKKRLWMMYLDNDIKEFLCIPYIEDYKVLEERYNELKNILGKKYYNGAKELRDFIKASDYKNSKRKLK